MRKTCLRLVTVVSVLGVSVLPANSASTAAPKMNIRAIVELANKRSTYVAMLTPASANECLENMWGANPPPALLDWVATLMLTDLSNRAKVMRGELLKKEAEKQRQELYYSLEKLPPDHFNAVANYTDLTPAGSFGEDLVEVMDCQYREIAEALTISAAD